MPRKSMEEIKQYLLFQSASKSPSHALLSGRLSVTPSHLGAHGSKVIIEVIEDKSFGGGLWETRL